MGDKMQIEAKFELSRANIIYNPDDEFYADYLKPYYVMTADGQYLFASKQAGRRPDRAFYMVPDGYKLGKGQKSFPVTVGKKLYEVARKYLHNCQVIVQEGIQGEGGFKTGLRIIFSVDNPHTAYIAWMGRQMVFQPEENHPIHCWNYIIPEDLPGEYINEIRTFWPEYDPKEPITLYDLTEMEQDVRRVISLGIDYFGGAYKKPNLTLVWNRAESYGLVSYHAGCTIDRVLKGLSGTGKTTLTVGLHLEQDDACVGNPIFDGNLKIKKVELIGLEAASFAKSEGIDADSPEYPGLMKSKQLTPTGKRPVVLAMNIDCDGVEYKMETIAGYNVKVPRQVAGEKIGSLQCTRYEKSATTNGRFIFLFSELNPNWQPGTKKWLKSEALSFKRFDVMEPIFRVTDPHMAVALDSGCESIITSAVAGKIPGTRIRSYAATDFMAREHSHQALLKLKMYSDLGLGLTGKLVFFICNSGFVGEFDLNGQQVKRLDWDGNPIPKIDQVTGKVTLDAKGTVQYEGMGEKIKVKDTKALVDLVEHRKIKNWIKNPIFGYLVPDPAELEQVHGMIDFRKRFNPLRFYSPAQIIEFAKRDIKERTNFLNDLFTGQEGAEQLQDVIHVWEKCTIPSVEEIKSYYEKHYGPVA